MGNPANRQCNPLFKRCVGLYSRPKSERSYRSHSPSRALRPDAKEPLDPWRLGIELVLRRLPSQNLQSLRRVAKFSLDDDLIMSLSRIEPVGNWMNSMSDGAIDYWQESRPMTCQVIHRPRVQSRSPTPPIINTTPCFIPVDLFE